jgi:hypothetical protein
MAAPRLEELEDFIRERLQQDKWTHNKISTYLKLTYPNGEGYSLRSIGRFCSSNNIHKTSRLTSVELDSAVSGAIAKVSN